MPGGNQWNLSPLSSLGLHWDGELAPPVATFSGSDWRVEVAADAIIWWDSLTDLAAPTIARGLWELNCGNEPVIWWDPTTGDAPPTVIFARAQGFVRAAGAARVAVGAIGASGIVFARGVAVPLLKPTSPGVARCSGAASATINAIATAQGGTRCYGEISAVVLKASAQGRIRAAGFATIPQPSTTVPCLEGNAGAGTTFEIRNRSY